MSAKVAPFLTAINRVSLANGLPGTVEVTRDTAG
jgi:hypothetical protein